MTEQEEKYIHFASCIEDFNKAWNILQKIKISQEKSVFVGWSFVLALIEYSKPYTLSHGEVKSWKLDENYIPLNYKDLHSRIINARHQIHAHSDLNIREAKLIVKNLSNDKFVGIVQNKINSTSEFQNIDLIIDLIEKTLNIMHSESDILEQNLPENKS